MNGNNVLEYIDNVSKTDEDRARMDKYHMSDGYINKIANDYCCKKKENCMRKMVTDIYRDALPDNCEIKDRCYSDMNDFINKQCPDGLYNYVTDSRGCALKDSAEGCSKSVDEACAGMKNTLKKCVKESGMPITDSDITYARDEADAKVDRDMDTIARKGNFSELSEAIGNNVKDAVRSSVEGAKEAKRANAEFEKNLKDDLSVTTKESVESRVAFMKNLNKRSYNLFEAIFASKQGQVMQESAEEISGFYYEELNAGERTMLEAVAEYTKHSVWKALKLKNYDINSTKALINDYLAM